LFLIERSGTDALFLRVQNYPSLDDGIRATADTLKNGLYGAIVHHLKESSSPAETGKAIADSKWGTGALAEECIKDAENPATYASWGAKHIHS
jgi:hypothetical protein